MPPKKKPQVERKLLLGRPGNTLSMGIVGLPNVGKSSTFNLLSNLSIPAENFPFCTIEPNEARVPIPDPRFDKLVEMWHPRNAVPAFLEIVDIAGLVPGASEGAGLGNAFLSNIARVDGIFQVVRAFSDPLIVHTEGEVDPVRDLDIIVSELIAKDKQFCRNRIEDCEKTLKRATKKEVVDNLAMLNRVMEHLEQGHMVKDIEWSASDIEILNLYQFLTAKPVVYLVNLSPEDYSSKRNRWLVHIKNWVDTHGGGPILPYSVLLEQQAMLQPAEGRAAFFQDYNCVSSIPRIIRVGYHVLSLIHYFTTGEDEVKCWTVRRFAKAPQAAGVIHSDFERGFICAEVMKYDDFVEHKSEAEVRAAGLYRQQGKEYEVEDGDIIFFRFNVAGSKNKR
jgi:obg-like ATPase 1